MSTAAVPSPLAHRLRWNGQLAAGLVMLAVLLAAIWGAPLLVPFDPLKVDFRSALQPPNAVHWLGTDNLGRDILARVLAAGKVDLQIAVVCVMLPFAVGSIVGAVAGYFGGIVDRVISGIIDILLGLPVLRAGDRDRRDTRTLDRQSLSRLHPGGLDLVRAHCPR